MLFRKIVAPGATALLNWLIYNQFHRFTGSDITH
jgi:hypothetical protein